MRPGRRRWRDERGSATVELVILTPLLILLLLFVVAIGRLAGARINVDGVAAQAARAASIARDPQAATSSAQQTAASALSSQHITCAHLAVSVDTTDFTPGGSVAVTVSCAVNLTDLTGLDMPVTETVANRAVSPIDKYRSVDG
jgi:Flp pilus assembly protein TadG